MKTYPVAETFISPQGEGHWAGVLCGFVRLAGCNVGKPYTEAAKKALGLEVYQEKCSGWDGDFPCDTNYRKSRSMTVTEILDEIGEVPRMLLTGGEPLMHDIVPLWEEARDRDKFVHIETSGTKMLPHDISMCRGTNSYWLAVSPKKGYMPEMLELADEIRVLVGTDFDEMKFFDAFGKYYASGKLFISAVNDEHTLNMENIRKCLQLQLKHPKLRISLQTHKILQCR
jgi:7-carboxy-7-deazaguanine synthase